MARSRTDASWDHPLVRDRAHLFREAVERHNLTALVHTTEAESVASIIEHGILSRSRLGTRGISVVGHGYGIPAKATDFQHYCAATLRLPHVGMSIRMADPAFVYVEPAIVAMLGTFFVPGNTASSAWTFDRAAIRTTPADFEALFNSPESADLLDWDSEVWIPGGIPRSFIATVKLQNHETLERTIVAASGTLALMHRPPELAVL
jgi:hypothetical protein